MDGAEMKKVGVILSLVEAAGTIVVQGQSPPLDEGCVLASSTVELQPDVRGTRLRGGGREDCETVKREGEGEIDR